MNLNVLFEEGTIFRAAIGQTTMLGGRAVRAKDVDVLIDGVRQQRITEAVVKDVDGQRVGTLRRQNIGPDLPPLDGDVLEIVVNDAADGTTLRRFAAGRCTWTRGVDTWSGKADSDKVKSFTDWDFVGVPA